MLCTQPLSNITDCIGLDTPRGPWIHQGDPGYTMGTLDTPRGPWPSYMTKHDF